MHSEQNVNKIMDINFIEQRICNNDYIKSQIWYKMVQFLIHAKISCNKVYMNLKNISITNNLFRDSHKIMVNLVLWLVRDSSRFF